MGFEQHRKECQEKLGKQWGFRRLKKNSINQARKLLAEGLPVDSPRGQRQR